MAQMRGTDTATKIQMQNLRNEVNILKNIVSDLLPVMKENHPNLVIKYSDYVER